VRNHTSYERKVKGVVFTFRCAMVRLLFWVSVSIRVRVRVTVRVSIRVRVRDRRPMFAIP